MYEGDKIYKRIVKAQKAGNIKRGLPLEQTLKLACEQNIINDAQAEQLLAADKLRWEAINVDSFTPEEFKA